ncbi:hypothetical protein [Pontibacter arcticus]|uniref:Uncharacterized protein n=1 Tax=Pontibacter arcticus TaxID=2080288 RepID=A0A364RCW8_9BACT|nr:hypothetical protein [Pontibacter arcticus]RAU81996.1 hypothetical protein DP923_15060 [Pontibacter arcticus]
MKHILLISLALLFATAGSAQGLKVTDDGLDKMVLAVELDGVQMANLEMKEELKLDHNQLAQIAELNVAKYKLIEEAEQEFSSDPILLSKTIYRIKMETDKAFTSVLSDNQLRQYLELEGRNNIRFVSESDE